MTYCVGTLLDAGMVFASDSRTNAGVDHVSSYRKMHLFAAEGERVIVILSSGNLSVTQSTISLLDYHALNPDSHKTVMNASSMYEVAELVGAALREVRQRDGAYLQQSNVDGSASFIVGGQIRGEPQRLFNLYTEGNFIEATRETPYFQIGESKYGKPVIDRVINPDTGLQEATKCVLVSFDSTMRSNISVGLPIDLLIYTRNSLRVGFQRHIEESDEYFEMIHKQWGEGLRRVFAQLPNPDWDLSSPA
ncbi:MAG: proteasome-type protease [Betaproteobacteria bacterium]|nr:proteasome-type protease [Betaproteobacteria bacterium]